MKVKTIIILIIILVVVGFIAKTAWDWTANSRAKNYGGTITIELPAGQKFEAITWKDDNSLWYTMRKRRADEKPESHTFQEESAKGIMEGTIIIIEK